MKTKTEIFTAVNSSRKIDAYEHIQATKQGSQHTQLKKKHTHTHVYTNVVKRKLYDLSPLVVVVAFLLFIRYLRVLYLYNKTTHDTSVVKN